MEIKFVFDPYKNYPYTSLIWYLFLKDDDEEFGEEIRQEVDLNLINQFGTEKLW